MSRVKAPVAMFLAGASTVAVLGVAAWVVVHRSDDRSALEFIRAAQAAEAAPQPGDVVLIETQTYNRRQPDPLQDPYHLDLAATWPERSNVRVLLRLGSDGFVVERDLRVTDEKGALIQQEYANGTREVLYLALQNEVQILELPELSRYDAPISVGELRQERNLEVAGEQDVNGETVTLLEFNASDGSTETTWQYGIGNDDGVLRLRRQIEDRGAGSEVVSETIVTTVDLSHELSPDDFALVPNNAPILDFAQESGDAPAFDPPPDEPVSVAMAQAETTFTFRPLDKPDEVTEQTILRGSDKPLSWDDLTLSQRHLQYATATSPAYRVTATLKSGGSLDIVQGPRDDMLRILKSTPALWVESRPVDGPPAGTEKVWVGTGPEGEVYVVGSTTDSVILLLASGVSEPQALDYFGSLAEGG